MNPRGTQLLSELFRVQLFHEQSRCLPPHQSASSRRQLHQAPLRGAPGRQGRTPVAGTWPHPRGTCGPSSQVLGSSPAITGIWESKPVHRISPLPPLPPHYRFSKFKNKSSQDAMVSYSIPPLLTKQGEGQRLCKFLHPRYFTFLS